MSFDVTQLEQAIKSEKDAKGCVTQLVDRMIAALTEIQKTCTPPAPPPEPTPCDQINTLLQQLQSNRLAIEAAAPPTVPAPAAAAPATTDKPAHDSGSKPVTTPAQAPAGKH